MNSERDVRDMPARAPNKGADHVGANNSDDVEQSRLLVAIGRLGQMVVTDGDSLNRALRAVNESAVDLLKIDRASIWRLESDGLVRLLDRYGRDVEARHDRQIDSPTTARFPANEFRLADGFVSASSVTFRDLSDVAPIHRPAADVMRSHGLSAAIVARIWVDGSVAGLLVLSCTSGVHDWSGLEVAAAEAYASLAGRWLEAATRHKALRDLDRQQRRMTGFAEVSSDCYWETDATHKLRFLSMGAQDTFGLSADGLLGQSLDTVVDSVGEAVRGKRLVTTLLANQQPLHDIDLRFETAGSEERVLRLNGRPMHEPDGVFVGFRGTVKDMTASFSNERRLRTLLAGIEQLSPINDHGHIDLNRVFRETVRLAAEAIDGIYPSLWLWDQRQRMLQCVSLFDAGQDRFIQAGVVQFDSINPIAREFHRHGVTVRDIPDVAEHPAIPPVMLERLHSFGIASLLDAMLWRDGGLVAVLGIGHAAPNHRWSVTEKLILESLANNVLRSLEAHELRVTRDALRLSEARFRDFAESASDWFWETGRDHRLTYLSEHHQTVSGVKNVDVLGRTRWNITYNSRNDEVWRQHMATLTRRQPFRDFRYPSVAPDGRKRLVSISGRPVFSDKGEFVGYRGSGRDLPVDETGYSTAAVSSELLRSALDALPSSVCLFDNSDRLVFRNRVGRQRMDDHYGLDTAGMHIKELLNILVDFGLVPEARGREEEWIHERLQRHASDECDFMVRWGEHGEQTLEVHHQRLPGGAVMLSSIDITQYSDRVADLTSNEARYKDFVAAGSDWVWETDAAHRFTFVSELAGVTPLLDDVELIGRTRWEVAGDHPGGFDWRRHRADLAARRPFRDFRFDCRLADGRTVDVLTSGVPRFDTAGGFLGYRGTGRIARDGPSAGSTGQPLGDLFDRMLDQLPAGIAVYSKEGRIVHSNPRFHHFCRELLGLDPLQADYQVLTDYILKRVEPGEQLGSSRAQLRARLQGRRERRQGYVSLYFGPGAIRYVDLVTFPAPGDHFLICLHDSTAEMEQVRKVERGLRSRALNEPLARVSTLLSSALESLDQGEEAGSSAIAAARHVAERLTQFRSAQRLQPRRMDLSGWLTKVTQAPLPGVPATLQLEVVNDAGPLYCRFDPDRLATALSEILINSADACGARSTVTLRLVRPAEDDDDPFARLCVMDCGTGFPDDLVDRAREPFVSGHGEDAVRGLGLTIAACSVEGIGGYMTLSNRKGGGATVELGLPVRPKTADRGEEATNSAALEPTKSA